MTPEQLELLRLQTRIMALEGFAAVLVRSLTQTQNGRQAIAADLDGWAAKMETVSYRDVPPEYSDLYAAEVHSAVESLVSFIKKIVLRD